MYPPCYSNLKFTKATAFGTHSSFCFSKKIIYQKPDLVLIMFEPLSSMDVELLIGCGSSPCPLAQLLLQAAQKEPMVRSSITKDSKQSRLELIRKSLNSFFVVSMFDKHNFKHTVSLLSYFTAMSNLSCVLVAFPEPIKDKTASISFCIRYRALLVAYRNLQHIAARVLLVLPMLAF